MQRSKKKKIIIIILSSLITVSVILYLLADRYLIEHVEISNVNLTTKNITTSQNTENVNSAEVASSENSTQTTADEWNYISDSATIAVTKTTTGNGSDTVTYYTADVKIADASVLKSAFAKNKFGTNIIETTSATAEDNNAVFAINGDYYGFRSDGIVIRNGVIYRDEPARIGLAFYEDGSVKVYDETKTDAKKLLAEGVINTMSFGPALIEDSVIQSNISSVEVDTNFGNHSIQGSQPRTGVGIIDENHFVFIVVDGRSTGYSKGVTLLEFAEIFRELGCTDAYNIDGGGSSTMYFMNRVVNNPLGKNQERGTSDIFYIGSEE